MLVKFLPFLVMMGCAENAGLGHDVQPAVEETKTHEVAEGVAPVSPAHLPSEIPAGADFDLVRRGLELASDTHRLLPKNIGNGLNCTHCHLQGATKLKAAPWTGVVDRYPRFRKRSGRVDELQDRMKGCFERSMNGVAPERDSEPMLALVAYATWLSVGVEDGKQLEGRGMPRIKPPQTPDPVRGKTLFEAKCAACHQTTGSGVFGPDDEAMFPPLWGERSFNIAAGMARLNTAAAFVKWNMPLGQGGSLTDQEAYDLAAYFTVQERPDFARKHLDWPDGGKPEDARY